LEAATDPSIPNNVPGSPHPHGVLVILRSIFSESSEELQLKRKAFEK
jgi:hypothetical protein